jgi:hypothetical protein
MVRLMQDARRYASLVSESISRQNETPGPADEEALVGRAVVSGRDATGLGNPNVISALLRWRAFSFFGLARIRSRFPVTSQEASGALPRC